MTGNIIALKFSTELEEQANWINSFPSDQIYHSLRIEDDYYYYEVDVTKSKIGYKYLIQNIINFAKIIYESCPSGNAKWIIDDKEYQIEDSEAIRKLVIDERAQDFNNPLAGNRLRSIINNKKVETLSELRNLYNVPFSMILKMNHLDYALYFGDIDYLTEDIPPRKSEVYERDYIDIHISNRYIKDSFVFRKSDKVCFENCIIDGDIEISSVKKVYFDSCIIIGKLKISNCICLNIDFCNIGQLEISGQEIESFILCANKIYIANLGGKIGIISLTDNKIIYSYLGDLRLTSNHKIDMSQFDSSKINHRTIRKLFKNKIPITLKSSFYLDFDDVFDDSDDKTKEWNDILISQMMKNIENYGLLERNHNLKARIMYEKSYCANRGIKKALVILTGGFWNPAIWLFYIVLNILVFAFMYKNCVTLVFNKSVLDEGVNKLVEVNLDWKTSFYYSLSQLVLANPTGLEPVGSTVLVSAIQGVLNTFCLANLVGTFWKKHMLKQD